ncbi:aldehyde dehydrogenase family protein [Paremcibacter congregatus]|uniref:Aldehyde dehydrogenase PuuC n=1 Tax=Paremcibacter congregatus TaxID=2043170 RepID=A0A2G4YTG2_9PROT|nr:aldehyde dehydrogenase family protein [Paremcibacter congregatus]PHZ84726.1 aldehyde dehydrogenase PuuC [Paremcibacter congregatus]QDE28921.1 aldehyde dehydrogenase family protein [Paremcibacter congregatus]
MNKTHNVPYKKIWQSDPFVSSWIEGEDTRSLSAETFILTDPSTGKELVEMPTGHKGDIDQAVYSARKSFDDGRWRKVPQNSKKRILQHFADLIEKEVDLFNLKDAYEMGKPISVSLGSAQSAVDMVRFYAEAVDKIKGDVFSSDVGSFVAQRRVPKGVVGAIAPWNFPTFNALLKTIPALAAGNSVVLKPSEYSPGSAQRLARLANEAGLPPGVLNVVQGKGGIVGKALGFHMDVDMIGFTGSTAVGKLLMQYAGQSNLKAVQAECGGKSPHIVFADGVDLDAAADAVAGLVLTNQGQLCVAGTRLLVQKEIEHVMLDKLVNRFQAVKIGSAIHPDTSFGPLVNKNQFTRVLRYIEEGKRSAAELVVGGAVSAQPGGGYFIEPTIFRAVSPGDRIVQEEIFGPVLSVMTFEDEDEAMRLANSTVYGLMAYVWTSQISTGLKLAKGIRSSVVVNACAGQSAGAGHAFSLEPFGQSGLGAEGGEACMENYLQRQSVWINHAE